MFGMIDNKIESLKMIGRREMNMDENIEKWIRVYEIGQSSYYAKPFFNDAKESFIRGYCISKLWNQSWRGMQEMINIDKTISYKQF